jgi:hypothetical protein
MAKLLGYQLANLQGRNIQGQDEDPTNLPSYGVMAPVVATHVMRQLGSRKFLLMPIYEGDIEKPELWEHV